MMALLQFFIYDGKLGEADLTDLKVVKHLFFMVHVKISKKIVPYSDNLES